MRPIFAIHRNGNDVTENLAPRVVSIEITDEAESKSDTLAIELIDRPENGRYPDLPDAGDKITAYLGYEETSLTFMGEYIVDAVTMGDGDVVIDCKSADMVESYRTPRDQSWNRKDLADIVTEVGDRNGYEVVIDPDLKGVIVDHVDQFQESDMGFLTRISETYDAVARPTAGKLVLAKRGSGKSVSGQTLPSITIRPEDTIGGDWSYQYSARDDKGKASGIPGEEKSKEAGGVRASYHDLKLGKKQTVEIGKPPFRDLRYSHRDEVDATAAANAAANQQTRAVGTFSTTLEGDPGIAAEALLTLKSWRPRVPVSWRIKTAKHSFSSGGYKTSVDCEIYEEKQSSPSKEVKKVAAEKGWPHEY
ncbi:phage late control D family protein [Pseudovibrio brasiliensis]|uniref:Phage late control gene D protein (GPD) n=1 Tax=Pseudovibrio brasiliensis TaxID=1898042 RepID=A0ABX8AVW3_9HYPH|nr:contractile injection system protein, VgrG/Pvc8 family [Pseudovibrio brasiliensis]QUS59195.1 hypothetical protein KGB56_26990 [Pseudovibrio brasiliensis]